MSVSKRLSGADSTAPLKLAEPRRMPWLHRARNAVASLLGIGLVTAASTVGAQADVPQHWVAYAQLTSGQLQGWLGDETNEAALRLQQWGQQHLSGSGDAAIDKAIVLWLWVASDGAIERVEFPSLGDAQADADLRHVLITQSISEPPPKDMLQPMVLGVNLEREM